MEVVKYGAQQTDMMRLFHVWFGLLDHRLPLPPFPTRRSSDLAQLRGLRPVDQSSAHACRRCSRARRHAPGPPRSEEHTSELQSHSELVCRLPLEKKTFDRLGPSGTWR